MSFPSIEKRFAPEIGLVQEALERLDVGQAAEQRALLVGLERSSIRSCFNRIAQPDPFFS